FRQTRLLEGDAQPLPQRVVLLSPVPAEDLYLARCRRQQPFQDFDGRGLARAVRSEQAEAFSAPDLEIEAVNRIHRAGSALVAFAEIAAGYGGGHGVMLVVSSSIIK